MKIVSQSLYILNVVEWHLSKEVNLPSEADVEDFF